MVLDCGSGQKMGTLPSFGARPPKKYAEKTKLSCKAMGIIIHGILRAMLLFSLMVPHGASMTCESILWGLNHLDEKYGRLPERIYIQLGNCSDNKARTVLAFLFDLRRRGILDKATVCMLIVGHTHIDIDQWFGVFSRALTAHEALSLPSYVRVLTSAFVNLANAPKIVELVPIVHDWDSFYAPHIDPYFANFSLEKVFKFKGDADGDTKMFYKEFMISKETLPRPFQRGGVFKPASEAAAASVFGALWELGSEAEKHMILSSNWTCGDTSYNRATGRWSIEIVGAPGASREAPSPGIRLLVSDPVGNPAATPVPEAWYKAAHGNRHLKVFSAIERTIVGMIEDGFSKGDSIGEAGWRTWLRDHRPREDGGCRPRDSARPFAWPAVSTPAPNPASAAPAPLRAPDVARPMADRLRYSGYGRTEQRRANAHIEEDLPESSELKVVVGQIIVVGYRYDSDAADTKRPALTRVVSVKQNAGSKPTYKVHWLCRAGRNVGLYAFSVAGRFRASTSGDFKRRKHRGKWIPATKDEHQFDVDTENVMCALCKTKQGCDDVPILELNKSGTIPNPRLATGKTLHEYIAAAVAQQHGVVLETSTPPGDNGAGDDDNNDSDDNDDGDDDGDRDGDGDSDGSDGDDVEDDDDDDDRGDGGNDIATRESRIGTLQNEVNELHESTMALRREVCSAGDDDDDEATTKDLILQIRVFAWKKGLHNTLDSRAQLKRIRMVGVHVLAREDGEELLDVAGIPVAPFRRFAGGASPDDGLMDQIRGPHELGAGNVYGGDFSLIGH